jgi:hypothetical protein
VRLVKKRYLARYRLACAEIRCRLRFLTDRRRVRLSEVLEDLAKILDADFLLLARLPNRSGLKLHA